MAGLEGECAVHSATTPSQQDVQEAVNRAGDGDTVVVPAGESTWASEVVVPGSKSLILLGAGIGATVITGPNPFWIDGREGKRFRLSGFTIRGTGVGWKPRIRITGTSKAFRIDHIQFEGDLDNWGIGVDGFTYGVIDHCRFVGASPGQSVYVFDTTARSGMDSWNRPLSLGSGQAVYVEDCDFDFALYAPGKPSIDSRSGGRYVFRHNRVRNQDAGHHDAETQYQRGTFSWELYENTFEYDQPLWASLNMRGGTGVLFNNRFSAPAFTSGTPLYLTSYRSLDQGHGVPWYEACDPVRDYMCEDCRSNCVSDQDCSPGVSCVQIDGHEDDTGYPCRDQVGRTSDGDGDSIQDRAPAYEWNNTNLEGTVEYDWYVPEGARQHIQETRDFVQNTPMPGYVPYPYPHPLQAPEAMASPAAPSGLKVRRLK
jgi:hypothetical protein